jgi:hypothetical protein
MARHRPRKLTHPSQLTEFAAASGGVLRLHLVGYDDVEFHEALQQADPHALQCASVVIQFLKTFRGKKLRCLTCEHVFSTMSPAAFAVVMTGAFLGLSKQSMVTGICGDCYHRKTGDELQREALALLNKSFDGVRVISIADEHIA